jgi:hypothetical protein
MGKAINMTARSPIFVYHRASIQYLVYEQFTFWGGYLCLNHMKRKKK